MDWIVFLTEFLNQLGPLAHTVAVGAASSLPVTGLQKLLAAARRKSGQDGLTREAIAEALHEHLPALADSIDTNLFAIRDLQDDAETLIGQLDGVTTAIRRLESTAGMDQDIVKILASRVHEALDAFQSRLADNEEQLRRVQDIRLRFLPARYTVVRDLDAPDAPGRLLRVLDLHPERVYLEGLVPRPNVLAQATPGANTLITGLPGAGKTTLIHQILLRDKPPAVVVAQEGFGSQPEDARWLICEDLPVESVLVYDNMQWHAKPFHDIATFLRLQCGDLGLLCACRSGDLPRVEGEIAGFVESLHITCQVAVPPLTKAEAAEVVRLCERSWGMHVEEPLREWLLNRGNQACSTPLYFVSLLAPVRGAADKTAHLADILALPPEARESPDALPAIWAAYFRRLDPNAKELLRSLRIVHDMEMTTDMPMVSLIVEGLYQRSDREQREARERLSDLLWISESEGWYSCYDIQLEAIDIPPLDHKRLVEWVLAFDGDAGFWLSLLNQGGLMQSRRAFAAPTGPLRAEALSCAAELWEMGAHVCSGDGDEAHRATFVNSASNCYADLAQAAESAAERRSLLQKALDAIEDAIRIWRRLNLPADLPCSLNNASLLYADLAQAVGSVEERRDLLQKALDAIEEASGLCRRLNLPADLAMSLNNASTCYSDLAQAAESAEERRGLLQKAIEAIEKAVGLYRHLNLPADVAGSLTNASNRHVDLALAAESIEERRGLLQKALDAIEEASGLYRRLSLPADFALSLNNSSNVHAELAHATESVEERRALFQKALIAIEEAIRIRRRLSLPADLAMSLNNVSSRYSELAQAAGSVAARRGLLQKALDAIEEAIRIRRCLNLSADLATSLNNASSCYAEVAQAAESADERRRLLQKASDAIEEASELYRRLNLPADLAMSLNNASNRHADLAYAVESIEERRGLLQKALDAIEEAVDLYRRLNLPADLAMGLNSASNRHADLAHATESVEQRRGLLQKALDAIQEASGLYRRAGLPADLIGSLNNASVRYADLAQATENVDQRHELLCKSLDAVEEAVRIGRRLNLPTDLATSLYNGALFLHEQGDLLENDTTARQIESMDEAISLMEHTSQLVWLLQAYPTGIRFHQPLMRERPESLAKVKEYARKAAPLLRAHGKEEEAEEIEEMLRRLDVEE